MYQHFEYPLSHVAASTALRTAPKQCVSAVFAGLRRCAATALRWSVVLAVALGIASGVSAQTAHFGSAQTTLPVSGLQTPGGVAVDAQGNVYVADFGSTPQIYKETLTASGYSQTTIAVSGMVSPRGIALDSTGNLYVADCGGQQVLKVAYSGGSYGATSVVVGAIYGLSPAGVAVDASGNVYFTSWGDTNVREAALSLGSYVAPAILAQFAGMAQPYPMAFDAAGNLFVADYGSNDVQVLSQTGGVWNATTTTVATTGLSNTTGIVVDASENVYLLSAVSSGQLVEVPSTGTLSWGAQGVIPTASTSSSTQNLAIDGNGNLYLADTGNSRVSIISVSGANFGKVAVGAASGTISLNFFIDNGGYLGSIQVMTQGIQGLDFVNQGTGSCLTGVDLNTGHVCTVNVLFAPEYAGLRIGAVTLRDTTAKIIATGYLQGIGLGPQISFLPGVQSLVVGSLNSPYNLKVDVHGNIYISDSSNKRILKETPASGGGYTQTVVENTYTSYGVAVDGAGNLYITDSDNNRLLKESIQLDGSYIETVLVSSGLSFPQGVVVDGSGNIYVVDSANSRVIKETLLPGGGYAQSIVVASGLNLAGGIAVDGVGNVFIADWGNNRVLLETLQVGGGYVQSTVGGSGLSGPNGVAVDGSGSVYIADINNNRILKVPSFDRTCATAGDCVSLGVGLNGPGDVTLDSKGNLYIADSNNNQVVVLDVSDAPTLSFAATAPLATNGPLTATVANIGNQTLSFPVPSSGNNPYLAANFSLLNTGTCPIIASTAAAAGTLASGASCTLLVDFAPQTAGNWNGSLTLTDNALNATYAVQTVLLNGAGTGTVSTTTTVTSSANPSTYGESTILTATVVAGSGSVSPTGTVQFMVGSGTLGSPVSLTNGVATYSTTALPVGSDSITAVYIPPTCNTATNACMTASTSAALTQTVVGGNYNGAVQVTYNKTSWTYDASTNMSICITPATSAAATGTVKLYDGSLLFATLGLEGNSCLNQWYINPILNAGSHVMTVQYLGDGTNPAGTSAPTVLTVAEAPVNMQVSCWSTQNYLYNSNYDCAISVSSSTAIQPTGSVDYIFDTNPVALAALSNDNASITLAPGVGPHTLDIYYPQTGNYATSGAQTESFSITGAPTYLTLNLSSYYQDAATPLTLSALVTSNAGLGTPTGNILFYDNGTLLATVPVDANGKATFSATGLSVGSNAFTATFTNANGYYLTTSVGPQTATVTQATQTITFTGLPASVTYAAGLNYTLGATASSTLPVTYTYTGPATLVGNVLTITGAGTVTVTASQTGNSNYLAASPVTVTIVVNPIAVSMAVSGCTSSPFAYGLNYGCTVTLSPAATGSINYVVDGTAFTAPLTSGVATFSVPLPAAAGHQVVVSYPGQGNYGAAAAQTESFTVTPAVVSVVLSTTTVAPTAKAGLTLLATTTAAGVIPCGSIAFYDGGTLLATVAVDSTGLASYTIPSATGGSHSYTALFAGTTNFVSTTSNTFSLTVALATQTITFTQPASPVNYGVSPISLSATATSGDAVTFSATGPGTISGNQLTVTGIGTITVTANQAGDSNYAAATAVSYSIVVNPIAVNMSPSCWNPSFAYGANYSCTVSLSSNDGSPTGSINYSVDGGAVQTAALSGGTAQFVLTQPAAGPHSVVISYPTTGNFAAAAAQTESFTVTASPVNVALTTTNWNPVALSSFVLTATVTATSSTTPTPSGTVAFYDGATLLQSQTLPANGVATLTVSAGLSAGSHTLWAYYTGGANYASNSTSITFTVSQASQTITLSGLPTSPVSYSAGSSTYTLIATDSASLPVTLAASGPATLVGTTLTITGPGTVTVTASQAGTADYKAASTVTQTLVVNPDGTTLAATCGSTPLSYGANYSCAVTVSSSYGTPTGSISYVADGGAAVSVPLVAGAATVTVTAPAVGTHNVVISYAQQGNFAAATSLTENYSVTTAPVTVTLTPSVPSPVAALTSITLTAQVSSTSAPYPGGTVTFSNGGTQLGTGGVNTATGQATLTIPSLTAGSYSIVASFAGNSNYATASSSALALTVNKVTPVVTWTPSTTSVTVGATLDGTELNATASVAGYFIYTPGSGSVLNSVGVQQVQALFTPNDTVNYTAATEVVSITVNPVTVISGGSYTLTANPAALTVTAGGTGTSTFTMTPAGGYTGTVTLSCGNLPTGVTCSFAPASLTGDGINTPVSSLLTVTVAANHAMNQSSGNSGMALAGFFFLPGLLLGGLLAWQRKRLPMWSKQLMALAILALMMGGASGCSGASFLGAAPTTEAVKVVAVSTVSSTNTATTTNTGTFTLTIVR